MGEDAQVPRKSENEDAQVRVRNLQRSVICITECAKVLKIVAHVRVGITYLSGRSMRVRTLIPGFAQSEKEHCGVFD